jgi:hypothetical protein
MPTGVVKGKKAIDYGWNTLSVLTSSEDSISPPEIEDIFDEPKKNNKPVWIFE